MDKTNLGFTALYSYHNSSKDEYLERALQFFQCALEQCGLDPACRAMSLFNLATAKFTRCLAHGTYSDLCGPIELYRETLELRDCGHPDRPATLLLLAQVLLCLLGREYDESTVTQIRHLLAEIHPNNSRERRTADTILRTCRLYRAVSSEDPTQIGDIVRNLDCSAYEPPYGYFDRPHILHGLGAALWCRFQIYTNPDDLEKSIALNKEALRLIPDGHHDHGSIVAYLGRSFLRRLEIPGGLTDVDVSADLVELRRKVVAALDNVSYGLSLEELHEQVALMSSADAALQYVMQKVRSPRRIPSVQSLMDEWSDKDGIPMRCRRQLGLLLSFLGGEGEAKMHASMGKMNWPFKDYKINEATEVLRNYMPYFQYSFLTKFGISLASRAWTRRSRDNTMVIATKAGCTYSQELDIDSFFSSSSPSFPFSVQSVTLWNGMVASKRRLLVSTK